MNNANAIIALGGGRMMWYYWLMLIGGLLVAGCTIIGLIGSARADRRMRCQWREYLAKQAIVNERAARTGRRHD